MGVIKNPPDLTSAFIWRPHSDHFDGGIDTIKKKTWNVLPKAFFDGIHMDFNLRVVVNQVKFFFLWYEEQ